MGKSLANRLGKSVATGLAAAVLATGIGAESARASPANWGSFAEIVPSAEGQSIAYTSTSTTTLPNNLSAILYIIDPADSTAHAVGGFDVKNGTVTQSYFNQDWNSVTGYGLTTGDTANTGSNPGNTYQTYYQVFYDANGDGGFGPIVGGDPGPTSEMLDPSQYTISNFTPYGDSNPTFSFTADPVPEPASISLALAGAGAIAYRRRRKIGEWIRGKFRRGNDESNKPA